MLMGICITGLVHASTDINDPKNFAWPYNYMVSIKNWFSSTPINLMPKPRLRIKIANVMKSCWYKFGKPSPENEQLNRKQLLNQAQSLLDQHLALVSKIANSDIAQTLCNPIKLLYCKLVHGYQSQLPQVKNLLREAGISNVSITQIGQEIYEQSRILIKQSKVRALARLIVPARFDLDKLITHVQACNNTAPIITFDHYW
jgi:hypothetical protein